MKFRSKTYTVDGMQFTYPPTREFMDWLNQTHINLSITKERHISARGKLEIPTWSEYGPSKIVAMEGDWIIRYITGDILVVEPHILAATFEMVDCKEDKL